MSTDTLDTSALDPLLDLKLDEARRGLARESAPEALEAALVERFRKLPRAGSRPRFWWMPPLACRVRKPAIGEVSPRGSINSILALGRSTKTTRTPCSGRLCGVETFAPNAVR